jgi:peptide deformylase
MTEIKKILEGDSNEIVQDEQFLRVPCEKTTIEEGEEIANKLFRVMTARGDGYGLAANQIGIQKQVFAINVKKPYYFINPRVVEAEGEIYYFENCLSFPGKEVRTKRYATVVIECDNYEGQLYFDVEYLSKDERGMDNIDVTEIVAIQHEMSHLEGKTMFDYEYKPKPIKAVEKYGRNEKIVITNDTDTRTIKYKNFEKYDKKGYRILE